MQKDLISRQMAVDTIMGQPPEPHYPSWYAAQIEGLPPAQVDLSEYSDKLWKSAYERGKAEAQDKCTHEHFPLQYNYVSDDCDISECPWRTVRKQGHWIISSDGYYPYCSECKVEPKSGEMTDFCPFCGADMRGRRF